MFLGVLNVDVEEMVSIYVLNSSNDEVEDNNNECQQRGLLL